jgi:hypothetical protein
MLDCGRARERLHVHGPVVAHEQRARLGGDRDATGNGERRCSTDCVAMQAVADVKAATAECAAAAEPGRDQSPLRMMRPSR